MAVSHNDDNRHAAGELLLAVRAWYYLHALPAAQVGEQQRGTPRVRLRRWLRLGQAGTGDGGVEDAVDCVVPLVLRHVRRLVDVGGRQLRVAVTIMPP